MSKRKDNVFTSVQSQPVESNWFDHSHDVKMTFKMGGLYPFLCQEVVPGDVFKIDHAGLFRFAPLIAPIMHRVKLMTEYFFVPNRIIWDGWEDFITGVGTPPEWPYIRLENAVDPRTFADYVGIPPVDYTNNPINVNALPMAAYLKIYDDWYRYAPVINPKSPVVVAGENVNLLTYFNAPVLNRAWEHDYFTSALPDTQQGAMVDLPLVNQQSIPVELADTGHNTSGWVDDMDNPITSADNVTNGPGPVPFSASTFIDGFVARYDPRGSLVVDVQAEAATINDLREAFALQAFLERTLRGGERYIEQIWAHFNVRSSDARLQRPEFLGRSVQNMTISEVLSTAQSSNDPETADVPVGQMAGHGISSGGGNQVTFQAEEHGFIIGIVSAIPETSYQDGLERKWFRQDRFDYMWPSFANLGERPILKKELVAGGYAAPTDLDEVFGYIPQYSEYRYTPSRTAGDFRDTLDFWTLSRRFDAASPPELNEDFVSCRSAEGLTRIFAVTDENQDYIFGQILMRINVKRRLPRYGVPQLIG